MRIKFCYNDVDTFLAIRINNNCTIRSKIQFRLPKRRLRSVSLFVLFEIIFGYYIKFIKWIRNCASTYKDMTLSGKELRIEFTVIFLFLLILEI